MPKLKIEHKKYVSASERMIVTFCEHLLQHWIVVQAIKCVTAQNTAMFNFFKMVNFLRKASS